MEEGFQRRRYFLPTVLTAAAILFFHSSFAFAQRPPTPPIDFSYLEVDFSRPGARSAAMGGAFIGAAQDETAVLYNPAGMTYLSRPTVSAHVRFYNRTKRFGFGEPDLDQFTVGVVLPIKKLRFGYARHQVFFIDTGFGTPQSLNIETPLTTRQVLGGLGNFPGKSVGLGWQTFRDNFSLAFQISKRVSVGATLQLYSLDLNIIDETFLDPEVIAGRLPSGNNAATNYATTRVDYLFQGIPAGSVGVMAKLIPDRLFVGAVATAGPAFDDILSVTFLPEYRVGSQTFAAEYRFRNLVFQVPDTYGIGLYYRASSRLNLTFDVFRIEYSDQLSGNDLNVPADDELNEQMQKFEDPDDRPDLTVEDATEFHVGLEWLLKKFGFLLPLRVGLYTDPGHRIHAVSNNPDLQRLYPEADDRLHVTFGTGFVFKYGKFDTAFDLAEDYNQLFFSWTLTLP